jgi:hypothetical protein
MVEHSNVFAFSIHHSAFATADTASRGTITTRNLMFMPTFLFGRRRRDSGYPEPPPQTRTCSFPASGSSVVLAHQANKSGHANTSGDWTHDGSVVRGRATPSRFRARLNASQVKLRRLPPPADSAI